MSILPRPCARSRTLSDVTQHGSDTSVLAGLVLAVTIPLAGRLTDRFPPHRLVAIGVLLLGVWAVMERVREVLR